MFPGCVSSFAETAALIMHMDVVVSVDTAVAHLSGALGRPLWLMIQRYSTDWRWLLDRDSSPWYSTARLFRQSDYGDWTPVIQKITQFLSWFKV
jgi:ADP-heptose:LPS heptosyltransferase